MFSEGSESSPIDSKFANMVYKSQISFTLDTICPWYVLSLLVVLSVMMA